MGEKDIKMERLNIMTDERDSLMREVEALRQESDTSNAVLNTKMNMVIELLAQTKELIKSYQQSTDQICISLTESERLVQERVSWTNDLESLVEELNALAEISVQSSMRNKRLLNRNEITVPSIDNLKPWADIEKILSLF